jgi:hypothetical protein
MPEPSALSPSFASPSTRSARQSGSVGSATGGDATLGGGGGGALARAALLALAEATARAPSGALLPQATTSANTGPSAAALRQRKAVLIRRAETAAAAE